MFSRKRKEIASVAELPTVNPSHMAPLSSSGNGTAAPNGSVASALAPSGGAPASDESQRRAAIAQRRSLAFRQIVTVLMRTSTHKHLALADLEWLVFPPLLTGQFSVASVKSKDGKTTLPAAVALWASVSADVDKRLSENLNAPVRLRPDEWRSGEVLWLVEALGDERIVPTLLKQLCESTFKGKDVKVRARGDQGQMAVKSLRAAIDAQGSSSAAAKK